MHGFIIVHGYWTNDFSVLKYPRNMYKSSQLLIREPHKPREVTSELLHIFWTFIKAIFHKVVPLTRKHFKILALISVYPAFNDKTDHRIVLKHVLTYRHN